MEMQEVEITIDKEGRVQLKVNGAHGQDCLALTRDLENSLGTVQEREYLPEFYEESVRQRQKINGG